MKRKNEKSDNICDKIINFLWFILAGFIIMFCVFILFSSKGLCAGGENSAYFPMGQNDNGKVGDDIISFVENTYSGDDYWIVLFSLEHLSYADTYVCIYFPKSSNSEPLLYGEIKSNGHGFSFYNFSLNNSIKYRYIIKYANNGNVAWNSNGGTSWSEWNNMLESSLYSATLSYVSNFQIYTTSTQESIILKYSDGPVIEYGHATPPNEFHNPYFNPNSHAQPPVEVPPQVTINNYSWNTYNPPAIDDTDIISTLKSLIYVVNYLMGWLKDNISGEFQNLLSNLKGFFDYIGQTIQYYGGLIIDNIQNLITTFYNNMVSLVEDIAEKVGYIGQPFDSIALIDAFESMQIYDDYDRCGQLIDDAFGFFDDITEPTNFTIPIDLRGITLLHQTQILYFDLGWINSAKSVIRVFMWTVTTFGLLYTVIDSIPDYLLGQDE